MKLWSADRAPKLAAILTLALLLRVLWAFHSPSGPAFEQEQADQGAGITLNMLAGKGYTLAHGPGAPRSSFRMPAVPLLLYSLWSVTGPSALAAKLAMAAFGTLNVLLLALLACRLFGPLTALAAALVAAGIPNMVYWSGSYGPETLAMTALLLLTLFLAEERHLLAGLPMGALLLLRPIYFPYLLLLVLWIAWTQRRGAPLSAVCRFLIPVALVLAPWVCRNWLIHHRFLLTSTEGGMTFLECNNPVAFAADAQWQPRYLESLAGIDEKARTLSEVEFDRLMYKIGLQNIREDLGGYARAFLLRVSYVWRPFPRTGGNSKHTLLHVLVMCMTWLPVFLLALWQMIRAKVWREPRHAPILLAILSLTVCAGLVNGVLRYRAPLESFFVIYAAAALAKAYSDRFGTAS